MNGYGVMKYANGYIYKGQFQNNLPDGEGLYTWGDGSEFKG